MTPEGSQGFAGTRDHAKQRLEQRNMSLFLGKRETKLYELEDENMISKFIERGTN